MITVQKHFFVIHLSVSNPNSNRYYS